MTRGTPGDDSELLMADMESSMRLEDSSDVSQQEESGTKSHEESVVERGDDETSVVESEEAADPEKDSMRLDSPSELAEARCLLADLAGLPAGDGSSLLQLVRALPRPASAATTADLGLTVSGGATDDLDTTTTEPQPVELTCVVQASDLDLTSADTSSVNLNLTSTESEPAELTCVVQAADLDLTAATAADVSSAPLHVSVLNCEEEAPAEEVTVQFGDDTLAQLSPTELPPPPPQLSPTKLPELELALRQARSETEEVRRQVEQLTDDQQSAQAELSSLTGEREALQAQLAGVVAQRDESNELLAELRTQPGANGGREGTAVGEICWG